MTCAAQISPVSTNTLSPNLLSSLGQSGNLLLSMADNVRRHCLSLLARLVAESFSWLSCSCVFVCVFVLAPEGEGPRDRGRGGGAKERSAWLE